MADIDLHALPERLDLPKPRLTSAMLVLIGGGFAAIGIWMIRDGEALGWTVAGFFGLCAAIGVAQWFSNAGVSLDRDGFEVRSLMKRTRYAWSDVSAFGMARVRANRFLTFEHLSAPRRPMLDGASRVLVGTNAAIAGSLIGGDPAKACALMNAFRDRALKGKA